MDISVITIGGSKVILLPETLLEKYNIKDKVELILEKDHMVLKSKSREGSDNAFNNMHGKADERLLKNDVFDDENF